MIHTCPVEHIETGAGALAKLHELCKDYSKILLVSDENTWEVCGKKVFSLLEDKLAYNYTFYNKGKVLVPDEKAIAELESELEKTDTDLIVGVGSGVINDLCKHISFQHDLPYYIVATAPSMDGYVSVGAALILEGMKVTLNARPPLVVIADTDVLVKAPMEMLQAGYGDIIGKYSCLNDWKLSALINEEYFCEEIYNMTYEAAKKVESLGAGVLKRDPESVETLMKALLDVGVAMSYVGNSRPASGSEHHLSHYFEITGIVNGEKYYPHGIDVAYSSVITAELRQTILENKPVKREFSKGKWETAIKNIYGPVAPGVISLQNKLGWYTMDDRETIKKKRKQIYAILQEAPTPEKVMAMLEKVNLDFEKFKEFYGESKIRDGVLYAKDLKDRYTVLWLYYSYFRKC